MHRRHLLLGLAFAAAVPAYSLAGIPAAPASRFRWTADGRVLRRHGAGWVDSINLGPNIEILDIDETGPIARLLVRHAGHRFELHSSDGRRWMTPGAAASFSSSEAISS
ncbi:hypothetical protein [Wenzhouxiangella marina]|uniref:Uncharacterized protein n=1 Tax=Wenzhouxiangella marina TaxID=1579979 RepID=A0A0K0XV68_9GAMM|nr:hypothetical protein [Wenzhouxiangella marina]AKS41517.1 hypothetical protein WM2015_1143 [Wenzhouxiangella marina]MBB6086724.1 hypothetical protein [Wenzhouxiangella marina]